MSKLTEETWSCWVPAQILNKSDASKKDGKRFVCGIASTDSRDLQGEVVDQQGLDFSYFIKHGYFNNDHKAGFQNKVGQPTECKLTKNGLWVKGFLFKEHPVADEIWELMNSLSASGSSRKVGFSIQGKVLKKEGNIIKKCWLTDIAITPHPVNTQTWAEVAKSLSAQKWDLTKDDEVEAHEKALSAGGGNTLSVESLDADLKNQKTEKSFTFDETVSFVKSYLGVPTETAEQIAKVAFEMCVGEE